MLLNEPVNFYPVFFLNYILNVLDYMLSFLSIKSEMKKKMKYESHKCREKCDILLALFEA